MAHRGTRNRGKQSQRLKAEKALKRSEIAGTRRDDIDRYRDHSSYVGGIDGAAKFHNEALIAETVKEHIVPRQSISRKQLLAVFPVSPDVHVIRGRQLLKVDGKPQFDENGKPIMIPFTNNGILKSGRRDDGKTLLIKGNPFKQASDIKRQTQYTKRIRPDEDRESYTPENPSLVTIPADKLGIET